MAAVGTGVGGIFGTTGDGWRGPGSGTTERTQTEVVIDAGPDPGVEGVVVPGHDGPLPHVPHQEGDEARDVDPGGFPRLDPHPPLDLLPLQDHHPHLGVAPLVHPEDFVCVFSPVDSLSSE